MSEIQRAIKRLVGDGQAWLTLAKVDSVDKQSRTCEATPLDGSAKLLDVRFQTSEGGDVGVCIVPVVGSNVLIAMLNNFAGQVVLTDEIDAWEAVVQGKRLKVSGEGIEVASDTASLKEELDNIIGAVNAANDALLHILSGIAALGVALPNDVAAITQSKVSLEVVKNKLNSILV